MSGLAWQALAYVALFAVLAFPWWSRLRDGLPTGYAPDAWLIVWVLEWCFSALTTTPSALFDPPVNHPAPAQLTGSEHFLSSQLVFAPLRWLSGDPVLAANLTVFLCFPLAATAMSGLLSALGLGRSTAFVVGFLYGFGHLVSPPQMGILQSQHFHLPLTALVLHGLRRRPTWPRAAIVAGVLVVGLLSSYHMAVFLLLATMGWSLGELATRRPARTRFALLTLVAVATAAAPLVAVSRPYLARAEAHGDVEGVVSRWRTEHLTFDPSVDAEPIALTTLMARAGACMVAAGHPMVCLPHQGNAVPLAVLVRFSPLALPLVALLLTVGLAVSLARRDGRRAFALGALVVALSGISLAGPDAVRVGRRLVTLPGGWLRSTPARFIRARDRALVLTYFGASVLVGLGLEALRSRVRPRHFVALATVLGVAGATRISPDASGTDVGQLRHWSRFTPQEFLGSATLAEHRSTYERVAERVAQGAPRPLLEWPPAPDPGAAVVGQMIHRQPSIDFYTGYQPVHVLLVRTLVRRLPDPAALDDLVDMTGLGWILVRPAAEWDDPADRDRGLAALERHARTLAVHPIDDFALVRLDPTSRHPAWIASLARGPRPGHTVLGTPLAKLPQYAAADVLLAAPATVASGRPFAGRVTIQNRGSVGVPAALPGQSGAPFTVRLAVAWRSAREGERSPGPLRFDLRRDVPPKSRMVQTILLIAPERPGRYRLRVMLEQVGCPDVPDGVVPGETHVVVTAR